MFTIDIATQTSDKLKLFLKKTKNTEQIFEEFFEFKVSQIKKGIISQKADLLNFEKKYNLNSVDFYQKYNDGQLGDDSDFMIWSGIYEMYLENVAQLKEIE